ncbi:MAG: hypothetical protein LUQ32_09460 [Methanomicrobiales archaeon]|nr:hypothetical protein [Methanomicrobiales archaeon]
MTLTWDYAAGLAGTYVPPNLTWDYAARLVICVIILALGIWAWRRSMDRTALFVGIAFGFFGIYYLLVILGLGGPWETGVLVLRYLGYLIVIYALYAAGSKKWEIRIPE